jgi:hypothetical protein
MSVSLFRLYLLRATYALLALAEGSIQLPLFFHHDHWTLAQGGSHSFLLALAILAIVGVRHPLQMLPLLFYEILWKTIWIAGIALPLWLAGQMDAETRRAFFEIGPVIVLVPIIPWRYVFQNYVSKPGDRWTNRAPVSPEPATTDSHPTEMQSQDHLAKCHREA